MKRIITSFSLAVLTAVSLQAQVYNFLLSGSQETSVSPTGSAGWASVELDGSSLSYSIYHEGTSGLTGAHFHGPAAAGINAGVSLALTAGPSPIVGSATLSSTQISDLTAGNLYVNLHTSENAGGELRGQVVSQLSFMPNTLLSGFQEVPTATSIGAGAALVIFNENTNLLSWDIAYEGLGSVTGMHFHGPAAAGVNAGVEVNVGSISGLTSESSGSVALTSSQAADLQNGLWYLNIHTSANPGGELRGQINPTIVPEPSTYALLGGLFVLGFVFIRRRL